MLHTKLSISQLNRLTESEFIYRFGGVFEQSPWVAQVAWGEHPFKSVRHLHQAMCAAVDSASQEVKQTLIRSHPDLAGKGALAGTLTPSSTREQASAGLNALTPSEAERISELNRLYRDKFGFPFVICARENKKASILAGMEARLPNSREEEVATALNEIDKIAWLRLLDLVNE